MKRSACVLLAVCACGGSATRLQLAVEGADKSGSGDGIPITMQTRESKSFALLAVGAKSSKLTFTSKNLPAFATLQQSILTLSPGATDGGTYHFSISVNNDGNSASSEFALTVVHPADPPVWSQDLLPFLNDDIGQRYFACPGSTCTVIGTPVVTVEGCTTNGDDLLVDVEVVPHGQQMTGQPTFTQQFSSPACSIGSMFPASPQTVPLPGLTPGERYDFSLRVSNTAGVAAMPDPGPGYAGTTLDKGWVGPMQFEQGPCAAGTLCACIANDAPSNLNFCQFAVDCCSGHCVPAFPNSTNGYGTCQ